MAPSGCTGKTTLAMLLLPCAIIGADGRSAGARRSALGTAARRPLRMSSVASPPQVATTAVVGGGPAGLATAIMLARRGWSDIHVFDRLAPPPAPDDVAVWSETARFYLLGLGGRGQLALRALDCWDSGVEQFTTRVVGRRDWSPGGGEEGVERIFTDRKFPTEVIARDRLVGALHAIATTRYGGAITIHHGCECIGVRWDEDGRGAALHMALSEVSEAGRHATVRTRLVVGADGTARALAQAIAADSSDGFRIVRYEDDNARVYKTVPLKFDLSKGWRGDINYSARTADGRINFDALPAGPDGEYCGVLLMKAADPLAAPDTSPAELRALLDSALPQFSALLSDEAVALVAAKPPSSLPGFRAVVPRLHHRESALLLGDAVHTVKPYFGLGANSAFEDVVVLRDALDAARVPVRAPAAAEAAAGAEGDATIGAALREFSARRAADAEALVRISRGLDRPGWRGFFSFVLPLILDGVCAKAAPGLFAPNTIAMLQKDEYTFTQVARRKRRDRALQAAILSGVLGASAALAAVVVRALLQNLAGQVALGLAALGALLQLGAAMLPAAKARSPADVLYFSKSSGRGGGSNEDFLIAQRASQSGEAPPAAAAGAGSEGS